jgi:hypothetical protein
MHHANGYGLEVVGNRRQVGLGPDGGEGTAIDLIAVFEIVQSLRHVVADSTAE